MITSASSAPVSGNVHAFRSLEAPSLEQCSLTMLTTLAPVMRSIAPPMPASILPGTIQLAMLPFSSTCSVPRKVASTWPPRIIANDVAESK